MRYYQTLINIFVLLLLTNCVGVQPQTYKINSNKIIETMPEPVFYNTDSTYYDTFSYYDNRQYLGFIYFKEFTKIEKNLHKAAVYSALENTKDFEITSWYSSSRTAAGKIRPIFSYPTSTGYCRDYQVVLQINQIIKNKTLRACKNFTYPWAFNYFDFISNEKITY